jgi:hypothetical protein
MAGCDPASAERVNALRNGYVGRARSAPLVTPQLIPPLSSWRPSQNRLNATACRDQRRSLGKSADNLRCRGGARCVRAWKSAIGRFEARAKSHWVMPTAFRWLWSIALMARYSRSKLSRLASIQLRKRAPIGQCGMTRANWPISVCFCRPTDSRTMAQQRERFQWRRVTNT